MKELLFPWEKESFVPAMQHGCRAKPFPMERNRRVPNRFFGIRDLAFFKPGIRDFEGKGGRDSGL